MTVWAILAASLLGSPHCSAMCGLVAGAASGQPGGASSGRMALAATYHAARLAGYLTLGLVAGTLGAGVDRLGTAVGWLGVATRVSGGILVVIGLGALGVALGVRRHATLAPLRWINDLARRAGRLPPLRRAAALGGLTAALPCGWLVAFLATAAATGNPQSGALAMAVFWLGTVPALVGASVIVHRLAGAFRRRLPLVAALSLIILGLLTALGRPVLPQ
jgi:sulfite exporter TauE/SafE